MEQGEKEKDNTEIEKNIKILENKMQNKTISDKEKKQLRMYKKALKNANKAEEELNLKNKNDNTKKQEKIDKKIKNNEIKTEKDKEKKHDNENRILSEKKEEDIPYYMEIYNNKEEKIKEYYSNIKEDENEMFIDEDDISLFNKDEIIKLKEKNLINLRYYKGKTKKINELLSEKKKTNIQDDVSKIKQKLDKSWVQKEFVWEQQEKVGKDFNKEHEDSVKLNLIRLYSRQWAKNIRFNIFIRMFIPKDKIDFSCVIDRKIDNTDYFTYYIVNKYLNDVELSNVEKNHHIFQKFFLTPKKYNLTHPTIVIKHLYSKYLKEIYSNDSDDIECWNMMSINYRIYILIKEFKGRNNINMGEEMKVRFTEKKDFFKNRKEYDAQQTYINYFKKNEPQKKIYNIIDSIILGNKYSALNKEYDQEVIREHEARPKVKFVLDSIITRGNYDIDMNEKDLEVYINERKEINRLITDILLLFEDNKTSIVGERKDKVDKDINIINNDMLLLSHERKLIIDSAKTGQQVTEVINENKKKTKACKMKLKRLTTIQEQESRRLFNLTLKLDEKFDKVKLDLGKIVDKLEQYDNEMFEFFDILNSLQMVILKIQHERQDTELMKYIDREDKTHYIDDLNIFEGIRDVESNISKNIEIDDKFEKIILKRFFKENESIFNTNSFIYDLTKLYSFIPGDWGDDEEIEESESFLKKKDVE